MVNFINFDRVICPGHDNGGVLSFHILLNIMVVSNKVSNKMAYANKADPDQTASSEQSDQGLRSLPFH